MLVQDALLTHEGGGRMSIIVHVCQTIQEVDLTLSACEECGAWQSSDLHGCSA